jgi:hypothetical protein
MDYTLLSSPLQFTDFRFRNAQNKLFGGIDTLALHSLKRKNGYQNRLERDLLQRIILI